MAVKIDGGERLIMTMPGCAKLLGIGRNECYKAAKKGQLPTIVVGRRILVSRAGLLRMIEEAGARPPA